MPDPKHEQLRRLFDGALELPAADRLAFLETKCRGNEELKRRLLAMLAVADDEQFLSEPTASVPAADHQPVGESCGDATAKPTNAPLREGPGSCIGHYKLLQHIGEGGFGDVFMAEQSKPVARRVALKIIKLGMDTRQVVARFEQERQALAMMDHPNIARVLDAGATETGRPYFVMDLVKGDPIAEYCDKNRLVINQRLALFAQVCHAVQHAHSKGIIHRDIKPSNILVGTQDGLPMAKVIDFGIAKATSQRLTDKTLFTEHQQVIGTLQYMSPEQAEGSLDIDTRTDVYSLGVLLYELLTGSTPFDQKTIKDAMFGELRRMIRDVEPPRPSTRLHESSDRLGSIAAQRGVEPRRLGTLIRGELDWIVMKALEKERGRRYSTAEGLAKDIQRYLGGEAVVAAPPSASYQLRKFVRRNKATVTGIVAVGLTLLLGVIGFAWQASVTATQRDRAVFAETESEQRATALAKVADFQVGMLRQIDATDAGVKLAATLRKKFAAALSETKATATDQQAEIAAFGQQLARINATDTATSLIDTTILRPALQAIETQFEDQPIISAQLRHSLAEVYRVLGIYDPALAQQREALAIRRRVLGAEHKDTLQSLLDLGGVLESFGRLPEAEACFREALTARLKVLGENHPDTLRAMEALGNLLRVRGEFAEATPLLQNALDKLRRERGDADRDTLTAMNCLGYLHVVQGKLDATEPLWREAYEKGRAALGEDDPDVLIWATNLGGLLQGQGKSKEAEVLFRESLARHRRIRGDEHPVTLQAIGTVAGFLVQQGRLTEAEPLFRQALEKTQLTEGRDSQRTILLLQNTGDLLARMGRLAEAESLLREALAGYRRTLDEDHQDALVTMTQLAQLLARQTKVAEGEALFRDAVARMRRTLGSDHPQTLVALVNLGNLLIQDSRPDEAEPLLRETLATRRRVSGAEHPETLIVLSNLGMALERQGKIVEAEQADREAMIGLRKSKGDDHPTTLNSIGALASLLRTHGRPAEAEPLYREALAGMQRKLGNTHVYTANVQLGLGRTLVLLQRFAQAAPELTAAEAVLGTAEGVPVGRHRQSVEALAECFAAWEQSEPGRGHDKEAADWRAKLATMPPPPGEKK